MLKVKYYKLFFKKIRQINKFNFLLGFVFVLGFLLRIVGTNPGYPRLHPDEPVIFANAMDMVITHNLDPFNVGYKFQYLSLTLYIYFIYYAFLALPTALLWMFLLDPIDFLHGLSKFDSLLQLAVGPNFVNALLWGRYLAAILGFLSIPLVYLVAKRLFQNKYIGLLSALFLAVNYRHVISSHLNLVDAPNSTATLLALLLALNLLKKQSFRSYIIAGIGVALAFSAKLYIFAILPFLFTHLLIVFKKKLFADKLKELLSRRFLLTVLSIGVIFFIVNPFLILHLSSAIQIQRIVSLRYGFGTHTFISQAIWYLYAIGYGKPLSLLLIMGILVGILKRKYWIPTIFLLLLIIPPFWVLVFYSHGGMYVRNFTSIIPFFSIFSALMVFEIFNFLAKKITILKEKTHFLFSIMVFSCIVGFSQFQNSINLDASLIKPWDLTCINKWMSENLKKEDIVARTAEVPMPGETTYLSYSNSFGNRTSYSYKELQEDKIDYAALDYELIHQYLFWWFGESGKSWGPPIQVLDNSFEGVVQKELSRHVVYSCIKPWPSIDPGYSLIKIQKPFAGQTVSVLSIDKEFKINTDSLDFYNNRVQLSGKIPVEENKKYIVSAFVKPDKDLSRETQNGALRVDFYPDNVSHPGKIKGKTASVSSRIWENDWQEKQIIEIAPKGTKYMIISFQAEDTQYGNTFFINKISISVSKVNPTVAEIKVANTKEIDNETLYYSFWF